MFAEAEEKPLVTLEQLRDYAAGHPSKVFPMSEPASCLGALTANDPMVGYCDFNNGGRAPSTFGTFLRRLGLNDNRPKKDADAEETARDLPFYQRHTGAALAVAMQELIDGQSPIDVADRLTRNQIGAFDALVPVATDGG